MKRAFLFLGFYWAIQTIIVAQSYTDNFGKFKLDEVSMVSYAPDKIAEAVVLYDIGTSFFTYDYDQGFFIIFERITKIKILSKAGLKYAQVEIPFYMDDRVEKVYNIEGYTYNIDNGAAKVSKLNPENTFVEKTSNNWFIKKFAMPDVKEGSVIEYRYTISSPYVFNFRNWEFQSRIPEVYSEYTVKMVPFYEYSYILQGTTKIDNYKNFVGGMKQRYGNVEYRDNIYTFGMKNVPAFRDEDFITSINDYILKIDFQLSVIHHANGARENIITTWPLLIQEMMKNTDFGVYLRSMTKNSEEIVKTLALDSVTNEEKAKLIFNYVKSNYNWSGTKSKFANKSAREFLKTKTGNSAEINLFLCSMLNAAGIQSSPVLISTRDHGKVKIDYPFQQFLNYVIVRASFDDQQIMLDATEPLSPFGILPARCINESGLVADKNKEEWVSLEDKANSSEHDSVIVSFNEAGDSAFYAFQLQAEGHKALDYRRAFQNDAASLKNDFITGGMEILKDMNVLYASDPEKPFLADYSVSTGIESVGNKMLVAPFPGIVPLNNPLKIAYRSYPVDMVYKNKNSFVAIIKIPKGYHYVEQNKNVSVDNLLVNMQYQVENTDGQLKIIGSYEFKKAVYLQNEYYDLKNHYARIVEIFNEKIILEKNQS